MNNTTTTKLQELYWATVTLNAQIFAIMEHMRKLTEQGKTCIKTQKKYFDLVDKLNEMRAEMLLLEADIGSISA